MPREKIKDMPKDNFDILIVGSGPGGYVAALFASKFYKNVCVIEKEELGGVCLNWGCIPTKSLAVSANLYSQILKSKQFGINVDNAAIDFNAVMDRKDKIVDALKKGIGSLFDRAKITLIKDTAVIDGDKVSLKSNGENIKYKKLIIATGASPKKIFNINSEHLLTSREILCLKKFPEKLLIIGGGVIGCEFASIFSSFGAKVT
ncbi:FAD-dependent oxidoreductase, partial [bacterium]|nr:FAD-dependent oxidoreductase [bacterium]